MSGMLFAIFDDRERAEAALREARSLPECARGCQTAVHEDYDPDNPASVHRLRLRETDASRGVLVGGIAGLAAGALLGWVLAGPAEMLRPLSPVFATVAGSVIGAAFGAGMAGLVGTALPARALHRLRAELGPGRVLVSIETPDRRARRRVAELLRARGAVVAR